ncbi:MAG: metallophosphoesterase family protein [Clostridia bacterium]|nr:metallophosphoesterase family protein [Clostridia bacterium]
MDKVRLLFANPGEDMSREIRFCWHSDCQDSLLNVSGMEYPVVGKLTDLGYADFGTYYKFEYTVDDLTPDTEYTYFVTSGEYTTDVHTFHTGRKDMRPAVIGIFSDVHMAPDEADKVDVCNELLGRMQDLVGNPDFTIFMGDLVKRGAYYYQWELFGHPDFATKYTMAPVAGNHDYYYQDKVRRENSRFLALCNTPENGAQDVRSSYYFLTNRVLFAVLDPIMEECVSATEIQRDLATQEQWLRRVLVTNEGKYDYIIVMQHYPHFVADGGGCVGWGGYDRWRNLFDEFGVDMAISGDYHCYVCSKPLYKNEPTDAGKGTVYVTVPMIAQSYYDSVFEGNDQVPWLDVLDANNATTGACYLKVDKERMEFATYDGYGNVRHVVTVPARKRGCNLECK